jgi:hypothetical protein
MMTMSRVPVRLPIVISPKSEKSPTVYVNGITFYKPVYQLIEEIRKECNDNELKVRR